VGVAIAQLINRRIQASVNFSSRIADKTGHCFQVLPIGSKRLDGLCINWPFVYLQPTMTPDPFYFFTLELGKCYRLGLISLTDALNQNCRK
jgi:hypothetical protein